MLLPLLGSRLFRHCDGGQVDPSGRTIGDGSRRTVAPVNVTRTRKAGAAREGKAVCRKATCMQTVCGTTDIGMD